MNLIGETQNFIIESALFPLVSREEGGHIAISPKERVNDLTMLAPHLAIEQMFLAMLTGEAMTLGLIKRGIDIGRINYQDNGNWGVNTKEGPYLHLHLFGRAKTAIVQKYGEACSFPLPETGFYDKFVPLDDEDISEVKSQLNLLVQKEKYQSETWKTRPINLSLA